MSGPRLLIVTHYWRPHIGGIETVAFEQCRRLVERGWDCTVLTSRLPGDDPIEEQDGVVVRRYRCANATERLANVPVPIMSPRMARDLRRLAGGAVAVLTHGHAYLGSAYAAWAAQRAGTPLIVVQHNPWVDYPHPIDWIEHGVDRSVGRWVLQRAHTVVAVSQFTARFVQSIAPRANVVVVRSGVDTDRFRPSQRVAVVPTQLFVTVRRLVPRNGVDTLLHAWRRSDLPHSARLLIAGDGPERPRLESLAAGDQTVRFLGRIDDAELTRLYHAARAVVLPTKSGEGFGLVVAEALACGIPVIATRSGGVVELIEDGVNGLLVEPDDRASLGTALQRVALDNELVRRLRAGAARAGVPLSWDTSIRALEQVLGNAA